MEHQQTINKCGVTDSIDVHRQGRSTRLLKMKPRCGSGDVDSSWSNTYLKEDLILLEVFLARLCRGAPKRRNAIRTASAFLGEGMT